MSDDRLEHPDDLFAKRFRLLSVLGEGGFGIVYLAEDVASGQQVAVKVLKDPSADRETRLRFEREVGIVGQIRSPHCVVLLDHGKTDDGELYAVFEYVDGEDLSGVLTARGRLPRAVVAHILRQVLSVLEHAHRRGLLHRDIKPQNVRVAPSAGDEWSVKLLDFGIARSTDDSFPALTATGEVVGTPRYMSPEQLRGLPLTAASDVYSVGLMGIELYAGEDALAGNQMLQQLERLQTGHQVVLQNASSADDAFIEVLHRMTAVRTEERIATARAALHALDKLNSEQTPPDADGSSSSRAWVLVVIAAMLLASFVAWYGSRDAPQPVRPPRPAKSIAASTPAPPAAAAATPSEKPELPEEPCQRPAEPGYVDLAHENSPNGRVSHVYVPSNYKMGVRHPLVVVLHPSARTAAMFLRGSGFVEVADEHTVLMVAPVDEVINPWSTAGDYERALRSIQIVQSEFCVDEHRIFVVGVDGGGRAAEMLSCQPHIRAIATSSFREYADEALCSPTVALPSLSLAPMHSKHIPVDGGTGCIGPRAKVPLSQMEERWKARNRCQGRRREVNGHGASRCYTWDCETPYVTCHLDGGHAWPGLPRRPQDLINNCDGVPADFPNAQYIWNFFASLGGDASE